MKNFAKLLFISLFFISVNSIQAQTYSSSVPVPPSTPTPIPVMTPTPTPIPIPSASPLPQPVTASSGLTYFFLIGGIATCALAIYSVKFRVKNI